MQGSWFGSMALAASLAVAAPMAASAGEWTLTTLYTFKCGLDGQAPRGGVVADASGALYGTTQGAGEPNQWGTVFKLTPPSGSAGWTEQVLLHFPGGELGSGPYGGVIFGPAGSLYGTAAGGGAPPGTSGIAFRLYPPAPGTERWHGSLVYSFANNDVPLSSLVRGPGNVLYGTGQDSTPPGSAGGGSVFALVPPKIAGGAWTMNYLHIFTGGDGDGSALYDSPVADASGALYGTAYLGGFDDNGIVFKLTPPAIAGGTWTETILYTFQGPQSGDGSRPSGGLVMDKKGALYGMTAYGGAGGMGTIFQLTPPTSSTGKWGYSVIHSFIGPDGDYPLSPLLLSSTGYFYGMTVTGGSANFGTVFRLIRPAVAGGEWTEEVLHSFQDIPEGATPSGPLLLLHGALYGTTEIGGNNCGTVFELAP